MKKKTRWLQLLTNIHFIHHIYWSFGWTFYGTGWGYFKAHGFKRIRRADYHNRTASNVY